MAEVEYVNEEEVVEEQYNDDDDNIISMESREATPPLPPAPPAASNRRELQQPEAPPVHVCTIHSTYAYITFSRERSLEQRVEGGGGQEGGQANR